MIQILFGAGFTVGLAMALGWLLLRGLRIRLCRADSMLLAWVIGSALLSLAVFALCSIGEARASIFLAAGIPIITWSGWLWWQDPPQKSALPGKPPISWQVLFWCGFAIFITIYFLNALAPEASPDGSGYHLGNVLRMWQRHGFAWDYHSMYAYFPQGLEMLFLVAVCLGGYSSAALVHTAYLAALPLLMARFGRRCGLPRAALGAGLLVLASPVVGVDGASAYNDVALATVSFAALFCYQFEDEQSWHKLLFVIGLLAGFCFGIKYTGWLALPLALWWSPHTRRSVWLLGGWALSAGPWLARNWLWLGNPVAPFLNRWFPNPYYYPGPEQSYVADLRHYEVFHHWWQAPVDLAVFGGSISGILGPVFLLAPLALLALRHTEGRRLLLAAAVWAVPAWFNSGARFLIPALPFLALAMGLALENSWGALPAVVAFQLWACLPSTLAAYAAPWSWRIRDIPVAAAFGRQPEAAFLASRLLDYGFKTAIDREVPPGGRIFSYAGRPEAYLDRTIVVSYESTLGLLVQDIIAEALTGDRSVQHQWRLEGAAIRGIRVGSREAGEQYWTVREIRVWDGNGEVRPQGWRLSASPNPWQSWLAFDGSPVTRWSTWQPLERGFWVQAEFPAPLAITRVAVESAAAPEAHPQLEVATGEGAWSKVPDRFADVSAIVPRDLRREAMNQLKARGIFYLLINDSDLPAQDLNENSNQWGVSKIEEAHGTRFYRIQ